MPLRSTCLLVAMLLAGCSGGVVPLPPGGLGALGAECTADASCELGLRCVLPTANDPVFRGGPAGGYCTRSCDEHADCEGEEGARCAVDDQGQNGLCVLTCLIGPALTYLNDPLDPDKCHGRADVRCTPVDINTAVCVPSCGDDSQCPAGRACDPLLTVCVDNPTTGEPWGAPCDLNTPETGCAGTCASFLGGGSACTSPCVLGGPLDPGTPSCGGIEQGYCLYSDSQSGAGDLGFCAPACTTQDDCQTPFGWCTGIEGLTGVLIDNGYCLGAEPCPEGQNDCTYSTTSCTPTKHGPFCLDPAFPLGSNAPG